MPGVPNARTRGKQHGGQGCEMTWALRSQMMLAVDQPPQVLVVRARGRLKHGVDGCAAKRIGMRLAAIALPFSAYYDYYDGAAHDGHSGLVLQGVAPFSAR